MGIHHFDMSIGEKLLIAHGKREAGSSRVRYEAVRDNEVLYNKHGKEVAIKTKGKILEILEGDV